VLSGGHAEAWAEGESSSPDVASRRDRVAGHSGNVRISLPRRVRVFEKPAGGSTRLGEGPGNIQSPHLIKPRAW
jgi:hypothetical protein